ncbi:ketol-acid reductoisomerase [Buchnera aphidicola str. Ak (Acyrthosiphon kondoi)]|uniref:Ketol-acid reductoisomerase (NADP(+)) n=1 Tax=Buchnera aphidicola str. Ak (Acyrthosiphon kondoi) TaxID=1005090 RepID=G2LM77_9GAMM|nr:ketol-acid reductoisomerase [Buchnera aphidicola]AEO08924.1 ketol-acid reductoisomerase [Buchnera aphidicola str. Ak (Acyrthosiphon kondoi)]
MNYFNTLNFSQKINQINKCRFMKKEEFNKKNDILKNKNIVIVGCGSQGLNQGLNMRESGLNISYALKKNSILQKNQSWINAIQNNFKVDSYESLIPSADLVINLTPDKQHHNVIKDLQKLMKKNSFLGYSHGFNIVEFGEKIRKDITVIMVAPKCPGTEVREEYKRGFGVPTLIAVHHENDINKMGLEIAKAWAFSTGGHRAGVLESSFVAEVKSDLMGEQTILCGILQTASLLCYEKLITEKHDPAYAAKLIQYGWETITESLKHGGITLMMNRLSNTSKIRAYKLCEKIKKILSPLFQKHMDDIISGKFSTEMMKDWENNDERLLNWRNNTKNTSFEKAPIYNDKIIEQEYYDHGILMIAILKSGIELSFEKMIKTGIIEESAYYESLHELPLIANTIARKKLYEMNKVISDTAEYGSYLFSESAYPILKKFILTLEKSDLGCSLPHQLVDNIELHKINETIQNHPIEIVGRKLRSYMKKMKTIAVAK